MSHNRRSRNRNRRTARKSHARKVLQQMSQAEKRFRADRGARAVLDDELVALAARTGIGLERNINDNGSIGIWTDADIPTPLKHELRDLLNRACLMMGEKPTDQIAYAAA